MRGAWEYELGTVRSSRISTLERFNCSPSERPNSRAPGGPRTRSEHRLWDHRDKFRRSSPPKIRSNETRPLTFQPLTSSPTATIEPPCRSLGEGSPSGRTDAVPRCDLQVTYGTTLHGRTRRDCVMCIMLHVERQTMFSLSGGRRLRGPLRGLLSLKAWGIVASCSGVRLCKSSTEAWTARSLSTAGNANARIYYCRCLRTILQDAAGTRAVYVHLRRREMGASWSTAIQWYISDSRDRLCCDPCHRRPLG